MTHTTMAESWRLFAEAVIPPGAKPTQVLAMKIAFFSGAREFVNVAARVSRRGGSDTLPTQAFDKLMAEVNQVLRDAHTQFPQPATVPNPGGNH
jgi:hypothetical protein